MNSWMNVCCLHCLPCDQDNVLDHGNLPKADASFESHRDARTFLWSESDVAITENMFNDQLTWWFCENQSLMEFFVQPSPSFVWILKSLSMMRTLLIFFCQLGPFVFTWWPLFLLEYSQISWKASEYHFYCLNIASLPSEDSLTACVQSVLLRYHLPSVTLEKILSSWKIISLSISYIYIYVYISRISYIYIKCVLIN